MLPGKTGQPAATAFQTARKSKIVAGWLAAEMQLLQPHLVIPVGKLAIQQFVPCDKLDTIIGSAFSAEYAGHRFDLVPLPHPSGASPWPHQEPGRVLLPRALGLIARHPAWKACVAAAA